MVRFVLVLLALVSAPLASAQTTLATWSGGSETFRAQAGDVARVNDPACYDGGACVKFSLAGGRTQQSALIEQSLSAEGGIYMSGRWRFPAGYSWAAGGSDSCEHKLMIAFANGAGRLLVNLRGCDSAPVLQAHIEGVGEIESRGFTGTAWPNDGRWHRVEAWVTSGRVRLYLDGNQIADQPRPTGSLSYNAVQFGAYVNQGADRARSFYVDDVVVATARGGSSSTPPPANPPAGPDLVRVRDELATAAEALARASDLLEAQ